VISRFPTPKDNSTMILNLINLFVSIHYLFLIYLKAFSKVWLLNHVSNVQFCILNILDHCLCTFYWCKHNLIFLLNVSHPWDIRSRSSWQGLGYSSKTTLKDWFYKRFIINSNDLYNNAIINIGKIKSIIVILQANNLNQNSKNI
jgi:hypothetical protein